MTASVDSKSGWFSLWFGFTRAVPRRTYLTTGLALMVLKYVVEAAVVYAVTKRVWTPLDYFSPSIARFRDLRPMWLAWAIGAWSIPFIWIGVSMTARRALDAGHSAKLALLFFVPVLNNLVMLVLAAQPTQAPVPEQVPAAIDTAQARTQKGSALKAASFGVLVGILIVAACAHGDDCRRRGEQRYVPERTYR